MDSRPTGHEYPNALGSSCPPAKLGRVLLVEDEVSMREALGPLLEEVGYEVSLAENGLDALRYLQSGRALPDVIVLDIRMPVMDGWEFRSIQRGDPRLDAIPVLAISADGSTQAAAISARRFLRKPVDPEILLNTLENILSESCRQRLLQLEKDERLVSIRELAATIAHEINNPLAFLMLNLSYSLESLGPCIRTLGGTSDGDDDALPHDEVQDALVGISSMLDDCRVGGDRIRNAVNKLQRLASGESHRREKPGGQPAHAGSEDGTRIRGRVLVIDDEPLIGRVIQSALRSAHDVLVFQRAADALARLQEGETFDLVLCDVMMPDVDGRGFYRRVAKEWPQLAARTVFMTGGVFEPEMAGFLERLPAPVLLKPFRVEVLRQMVEERVRQRA